MLFLRTHEVLALHARAIEEFGGLHGVRDAGALEAALTAAENRAFISTTRLCQAIAFFPCIYLINSAY